MIMPPSSCLNRTRRSFIRSGAGVFALPFLGSLAGKLKGDDAQAPKRFLALFFPNGVYPSAWRVKSSGTRLQFDGSLKPLAEFADNSVVITGLNNPLGGHLGQTSGFLSGHDFNPDETGVVSGAISLDQMLAQRWGRDTFVPSLNLAVEPPSQGSFGNRPRSFGNSISWSSPTSKIEPQINPQQAFDQVFFGQTAAGRRAAGRRRRIVDEIWGQAKALRKRVDREDHRKLDQYLDSIRDLEAKLEKTINPRPRSWQPPTEADLKRPAESGIPANHEQHMKLLLDIMLLALQTDSTRVGTIVMGHSISKVVYDFIDKSLSRNHHDYSHHRNDPKKIKGYNQITEWFAKMGSYMLERMDEVDEGNGSLLDNTVVLYGSCMKDGNVHEPVNVPVALFGGSNVGLKGGRRIACPESSILPQLHLSLLQLFGVEQNDFNGVTSKTVAGLV